MRPRGSTPSADAAPADSGFSIIEVIVSVMLLGIVAIAILPALLTGLKITAEQATTATATRAANAAVERAREVPDCLSIGAALAEHRVEDGRGTSLLVKGAAEACQPGKTVAITVTVTSEGGDDEYANVRALILTR